jgi:hypothetical protein
MSWCKPDLFRAPRPAELANAARHGASERASRVVPGSPSAGCEAEGRRDSGGRRSHTRHRDRASSHLRAMSGPLVGSGRDERGRPGRRRQQLVANFWLLLVTRKSQKVSSKMATQSSACLPQICRAKMLNRALQNKTAHDAAMRDALFMKKNSGGPEEDRTPDLCIANAALSQLSYRPKAAIRYSFEEFLSSLSIYPTIISER